LKRKEARPGIKDIGAHDGALPLIPKTMDVPRFADKGNNIHRNRKNTREK
jgi:hypothetical protein